MPVKRVKPLTRLQLERSLPCCSALHHVSARCVVGAQLRAFLHLRRFQQAQAKQRIASQLAQTQLDIRTSLNSARGAVASRWPPRRWPPSAAL